MLSSLMCLPSSDCHGPCRTFSRLNHSCSPNACYHCRMPGGRAIVRLLRAVQPGELACGMWQGPPAAARYRALGEVIQAGWSMKARR